MNKFPSLIVIGCALLFLQVTSVYATIGFESQVEVSTYTADKYQTVITNFVDAYLKQYDVSIESDKQLVMTQRNKIIALINTGSSKIRPEYVYALEYLAYKMDIWIDGDVVSGMIELENLINEIFHLDEEMDNDVYAQSGDTVSVHYVGSLLDGTVFDSSRDTVAQDNGIYNEARAYLPLEFTLGAGEMIPGFDAGVEGMYLGQTKTIYIDAVDAYGERNEDAVQDIEIDVFISSGILPELGMQFDVEFGRGVVVDILGETVRVDFNHFLAGEDLVFEVELLVIK